MPKKNNLLNHRFEILFTYFQVERNTNPKREYKGKEPSTLRNCYTVLSTIGFYLLIAISIHKMMLSVHHAIITNPLHAEMVTDGLTNPSAMNITILYALSLYLGVRKYIKKSAQFNVISHQQFKKIERRMLMQARRINEGYTVDKKELRSLIKRYNKIYTALITPTNMEIIMHKRHIDTLRVKLNGVRKSIRPGNYMPPRLKELAKKRELSYRNKLNHHINAVSVRTINTSIGNYHTIQKTLNQNKLNHKSFNNVLYFQVAKFRTVQQVRNLLKDA